MTTVQAATLVAPFELEVRDYPYPTELEPGESKRVTIAAEPKVLAFFDGGAHRVAVARAADAAVLTGEVASQP